MNFALMEMTALRYFMPLVIEGNKRNIVSTFFVGRSNKYNCPFLHMDNLKSLSDEFKFKIKPIDKLCEEKGVVFFIESVGLDYASPESKKVTIIFGTDFRYIGDNYIDKVDHIVFPSEFVAKYYKFEYDKNLYFGSASG